MATTLAALITEAKTMANAQTGGVFTTAEWESAVNRGVEAFWVDVLAVNQTLRVTTVTLTVTVASAALPADFMSALKVTRNAGTSSRQIIYRASDETPSGVRTYRLEGSTLFIDPIELAPGSYELRYNPLPVALVTTGSPVDLDAELSQFREYFSAYAAIAYLTSEESDTSAIEKRFKAIQARAIAWASRQRSAEPNRVRDVRPRRRYVGSR